MNNPTKDQELMAIFASIAIILVPVGIPVIAGVMG